MDKTPTGQSDSSQPVAPTCLPKNDELISDVMEVENTVLALFPPDLPRATRPVKGAHLGVPKRIYDWDSCLELVFGPYLGQAKSDKVAVNVNGQKDIVNALTKGESDAVSMCFPRHFLLSDVVNLITCTVIRGSANMGTSEPPLEVLYNEIVPGNADRSPGDNAHSELELILPDALRKGVGPDFPAPGAELCVSYPYCRAFDVIRVNLNGHSVYHVVTKEQAPNPGSNVPVKVCFNIARADLEKAGDHSDFKISCTVTDDLGNTPYPDSLWSAVETIEVDLAGVRFPEFVFREVLGDSSDVSEEIDLEKLVEDFLSVVLSTVDSRIKVGDFLFATCTIKEAGQPDVVLPLTGTVEAGQGKLEKRCVIRVDSKYLKAGATVAAGYSLFSGNALIGTSKVAHARVVGEDLPPLQQPQLLKSANGVLDPMDPANLQGVIGRAEIRGFRQGDQALLNVQGATGEGSPALSPKPLNSNSRANFPLSSAFIAANLGQRVYLSFKHLRNGTPTRTSPTLSVTIGLIPDYHPLLSTPNIDNENGKYLDLTQKDVQTLLYVGHWPHQVKNQLVTFTFSGTDREGKPTSIEDEGIFARASGLSRKIPFHWFSTLLDGSEVEIDMSVIYSGRANDKKAVKFPKRIYTVKTLLTENFDNELSLTIRRAGEVLVTPVLTFKLLTTAVWPANPAFYTHAEIGTGEPGKQLHWYVVAQEKADITLIRPCQKVSFKFAANQPLNTYGEVHFYDNDGRSLGQVRLDRPYRVIEFSGLNIKRLELVARGNVAWVFDDFVLTP